MKLLAALATERGLSLAATDTLVAYGSDYCYGRRTLAGAERAITGAPLSDADRALAVQALCDYAAALPAQPRLNRRGSPILLSDDD